MRACTRTHVPRIARAAFSPSMLRLIHVCKHAAQVHLRQRTGGGLVVACVQVDDCDKLSRGVIAARRPRRPPSAVMMRLRAHLARLRALLERLRAMSERLRAPLVRLRARGLRLRALLLRLLALWIRPRARQLHLAKAEHGLGMALLSLSMCRSSRECRYRCLTGMNRYTILHSLRAAAARLCTRAQAPAQVMHPTSSRTHHYTTVDRDYMSDCARTCPRSNDVALRSCSAPTIATVERRPYTYSALRPPRTPVLHFEGDVTLPECLSRHSYLLCAAAREHAVPRHCEACCTT